MCFSGTDRFLGYAYMQVVRLLVGHLVEQASGEGGRARRADERGSRLSTTDGDGFTPLHAGVIGQNRDVLATILESGERAAQEGCQ